MEKIKILFLTLIAFTACNLELSGQENYELKRDRNTGLENTPSSLDLGEGDSFSRDDQFGVLVMPGLTMTSKLRPIFSYSIGARFMFNQKGDRFRFSLGASIDHSFMKSHESPITYTPKSDTTYILYWNIAHYALHLGWDLMLKNDEKSKLYLRAEFNGGSYIHRSRTSRYYDQSQQGKLVDENYSNLGQPVFNFMLGITLGIGYEYYIKPNQSISFTPSLYYRGSDDYVYLTFGINSAYNFGLSKKDKR